MFGLSLVKVQPFNGFHLLAMINGTGADILFGDNTQKKVHLVEMTGD